MHQCLLRRGESNPWYHCKGMSLSIVSSGIFSQLAWKYWDPFIISGRATVLPKAAGEVKALVRPFLASNIKLPAFLGRPLKNLEDALCKFDEYYRSDFDWNHGTPKLPATFQGCLEEIEGVEIRRTTGLLLALVYLRWVLIYFDFRDARRVGRGGLLGRDWVKHVFGNQGTDASEVAIFWKKESFFAF